MAEESKNLKERAGELNQKFAQEKTAYETLLADKSKEEALRKVEARLKAMKATNEADKVEGKGPTYDKSTIEAQEQLVKEAQEALKEYEKNLKEALAKVNSRLSELEKMPGMRDYLQSILARRFEKSIKKSKAELDTYKRLKQIIEEHPNVKATIKGIVNSNRKISSLQSKVDKIEAIPEADRTEADKKQLADAKTELAAEQGRLTTKRTQMNNFLKENYPDVTEEQQNIIGALTTADMDRAIAGKEKNIENRQQEYAGITGHRLSLDTKEESKDTEGKEQEKSSASSSSVPAKLGLWARFKNWVKQAWQGKKSEAKTETEESTEKDKSEESDKKEKPARSGSEFRGLYRVDDNNIIKAYVDQKEEDIKSVARETRREMKKNAKGKDQKEDSSKGEATR